MRKPSSRITDSSRGSRATPTGCARVHPPSPWICKSRGNRRGELTPCRIRLGGYCRVSILGIPKVMGLTARTTRLGRVMRMPDYLAQPLRERLHLPRPLRGDFTSPDLYRRASPRPTPEGRIPSRPGPTARFPPRPFPGSQIYNRTKAVAPG